MPDPIAVNLDSFRRGWKEGREALRAELRERAEREARQADRVVSDALAGGWRPPSERAAG